HIFVLEDLDGGFGKPAAVDDGSVVQLVRENQVLLAENGRDSSGVGGEARLKHHARFGVLEPRNLLFEFHVDLHRARNRAYGSRAHTEVSSGLERRAAQFAVGGQTQIVVRAEVDHLLAVEVRDWLLFNFQYAQAEIKPLGFQVFEFVMQIGERISGGGG